MKRKQPTPIRDLLEPLVQPIINRYAVEPFDFETAIRNDPRATPRDDLPVPPHLKLPTDTNE